MTASSPRATELAVFEQLMRGCEEFHALIDELGLTAWPDFGTLLGLARHRNIIPWDYDADYCMLDADYRALCAAFEEQGGTIGSLRLRRDYYGEPDACCALLFTEKEELEGGIDIVSYVSDAGVLRSRMSAQLVAEYPDNYDMAADIVFPLRREWFLGRRVAAPRDAEARVRELFGAEWRRYPEGRTSSDVTEPPFRVLPEEQEGGAVIRAVTAEDLRAASIAPEAAARMTFAELVLANDRALWGRVHLGMLSGERISEMEGSGWIVATGGQ